MEVATTGFIASVFRPDVKTAATSGWLPNEGRGPHVLDNVKYLKLVGELARVLGFELEASFRDTNGKSLPEHYGRFTASHSVSSMAGHYFLSYWSNNLTGKEISYILGHCCPTCKPTNNRSLSGGWTRGYQVATGMARGYHISRSFSMPQRTFPLLSFTTRLRGRLYKLTA